MNHHDADHARKHWDELSDDRREIEKEALRNWRSWGSWFSWGSPVGLGLFLVSIGVLLVLMHFAGLIGR